MQPQEIEYALARLKSRAYLFIAGDLMLNAGLVRVFGAELWQKCGIARLQYPYNDEHVCVEIGWECASH